MVPRALREGEGDPGDGPALTPARGLVMVNSEVSQTVCPGAVPARRDGGSGEGLEPEASAQGGSAEKALSLRPPF